MAVPMKTTNGNRKLILDVDTGIDDALALAYLASFNNIEILGVIGTYGNVAADTAVYNTAYVLERLGFRNVPVLRGSDTSLLGRPRSFPTQVARSSMVRMGWADSVRLLAPLPLLACPIRVNRTFRAPQTPSMCPIQENRTLE